MIRMLCIRNWKVWVGIWGGSVATGVAEPGVVGAGGVEGVVTLSMAVDAFGRAVAVTIFSLSPHIALIYYYLFST